MFCTRFFFTAAATAGFYTLSLHDALPISARRAVGTTASVVPPPYVQPGPPRCRFWTYGGGTTDRKSTRLNSSHPSISYAVFCLKKKKIKLDAADGVVSKLSLGWHAVTVIP